MIKVALRSEQSAVSLRSYDGHMYRPKLLNSDVWGSPWCIAEGMGLRWFKPPEKATMKCVIFPTLNPEFTIAARSARTRCPGAYSAPAVLLDSEADKY